MFTINTIEKMLKTFKVQVSLRDEEDKIKKSNFHFLTVLPCWLALWFCPTHSKIRSARQKQTENTHILGKKLQRPLLSPYRWNAGWSGSIMKTLDRQVYPANKNIVIFHRINPSINYFTGKVSSHICFHSTPGTSSYLHTRVIYI